MTLSYRSAGPAPLAADCLIIGSGAGGSTLAHALTAAGRDVLLLEEGPYVPASEAPAQLSDSFRRMWRGGGLTVAMGAPPLPYAEGQCVGGGTEINSAIMQRTPPELLDQWAQTYAIADFGAAAMDTYYRQAEDLINASVTEGDAGPPTQMMKDAAARLGWKGLDLKRAQKDCVGTNFCSLGCPTGGKQSMTTRLLPEALARGLRLIAECRVQKLAISGGRVTEVRARARDAGGRWHWLAIKPQDVFVCAGATQTPALLMRSGLTENIGSTLRFHPTLKMLGFFKEPVHAAQHRLPLFAVTEFMPELRLGGSITLPATFGLSLAENWEARAPFAGQMDFSASYYAMIRPQGVGAVKNLPGLRDPLITHTLTDGDWQNVQRGREKLAQLMFAMGAQRVFPSIAGHPGWAHPDQVETNPLPRDKTQLMTIHMFSSCPPGEAAGRTATNSFGRVRGVRNLMVADASQIPEAPGANPQLTIMALALRAASHYLSGA